MNQDRRRPHDRSPRWLWPLLIIAALALEWGCSQQQLPTSYGAQRRRFGGDASVNGTDVFAEMFRQAGHDVVPRRMLITHEMDDVDTIVWFPNDWRPPRPEAIEWFDNWLSEGVGRTLIYVGRDFNAAPLYWKKMAPLISGDQVQEFDAREANDRFEPRSKSPHGKPSWEDSRECEWFRYEDGIKDDLSAISGPLAHNIDGKKAEIQLHTRMVPAEPHLKLLYDGENVIVARQRHQDWHDGQLITVANGSFLLNLPLVNHEHRKLATRLIEATHEGHTVVFLESGSGGPLIDPETKESSLWQVFGAWPLNVILLHLAVLGVIFCFARWPIFGRPQDPPSESSSDFGKHVDALGKLLRRTRDRPYAAAQLPSIDETSGARQLRKAK